MVVKGWILEGDVLGSNTGSSIFWLYHLGQLLILFDL